VQQGSTKLQLAATLLLERPLPHIPLHATHAYMWLRTWHGGTLGPSSALGLDVFFAMPPGPILQEWPKVSRQVQTHCLWVYNMSKVCRSARLVKSPTTSMVKKAQINLCWCLYLLEEEHAPLKEVMNNYITMFCGPLPPHIIVALTTLFGTPPTLN